MGPGSYSFEVKAEYDGMTARGFLRKICGLTARSMTILKYDCGIRRSGEILKAHDIVHTGDIIELSLPADVNDIEPVDGELDILYEDEYLLIVNKPPFMPAHPTKTHQLDTLANIVTYYQRKRGENYTFRALNRLDKDTSGCVVIAKDRLAYALTQPTVRKTYIAVCEGILTESGVIDAPIALSEGSKIKRAVVPENCAAGQRAVTHYRPVSSANGHTMLELWLETGRTHQIRCHMNSIGHPLAGDDLYGGSREYIERQALHCKSVSFVHPLTKEELFIDSPVPNEFFAILSSDADALPAVDSLDPAERSEDQQNSES